MVYIELLGLFRAHIHRDDTFGSEGPTDVTPSSARERLALASLALAAPGSLTAIDLANELYTDRDVADPRNAVQATVSRLRKALGAESATIETSPGGYRLVGADLDVDAMEQHRASGDLDAALALWRGPTLAGLQTGPLLTAERVRLEEIRAELVEQHLTEQINHDPAAAVADLEVAVADAPLREHRWELLMLALYQSGRQADALRAFQRARTHLSSELGLEPGPTLADLEQQILRQDPALAPRNPPQVTAASRSLPSGTVTVLLCDVEGSVRRWEAKPTDMAVQIQQMHQTWTAAIEDAGGSVVKSTGDGVLALFATASDAIRAAATGQREQLRTDLRVRVALHTGEVVSLEDDVRGPTVNRTARLMDLANGQQVLVSGVTADLAASALTDSGLGLRAIGQHWLRDVAEPVEIHQLTGDGLPASFPALKSSGPSQLPRLRNALLGREGLRSELTDLVATEALVTLLGTGGIGKTSLALAVGWTAADTRPVTFVDLASVRDPSHVPSRIAETLVGADPSSGRSPIERITDRLGANPDLLVIDNAEHLLDAVAETVDQILSSELKGSLLVTSRQPLAVSGERVFRLPPLPLPDADADLADTSRNPSVQLFMERMRSTKPGAGLPDGLLPVVAHICRRLDGIPLAIELAAGRTGLLAVEDIAARLDDQLRLLRQVPATREARHASLEAVARWSLDQLEPSTRKLFAHLAVMAGGFDIAGVEALATHADLDPLDALDGVSEMLAASLLASEPGDRRFRMLEPIRQLALSELRAAGAETQARHAHAEWITDRALEAYRSEDEKRAIRYRSFDIDADQLLSALRWSCDRLNAADHATDDPLDDESRALRAASLGLATAFWFLEQDPGTGTSLLGELRDRVDRVAHPLAWARATIAWTVTTATLPVAGHDREALDAVAIFDANDDEDRGTARLGAIFALFAAQDAGSRDLLAEAERMVPSDRRWTRAILELVAMMIEAAGSTEDPPTGSMDKAIERGERAATALRSLNDRWALGAALGELGRLRRLMGDYEAAAANYHESIDLFGDLHYHGLHYILSELGQMSSLQGNHSEAQRFHGRALQMATDDGNASCRAQALLASARSALLAGDETTAIVTLAEAKELHPDWEILSYGLEDIDAQLEVLSQY